MKKSEALNLAIEMLERIGPGGGYDSQEFRDRLRAFREAASSVELALVPEPRTAVLAGEQFYEIDRKTIKGRNLILMESARDYGEAPGIIVDADTDEIVLEEVNEGFLDLLDEETCT
jgi:hypothetical protein